ncbi:hypothetical protein EN809_003585 [Mesorhizobium sp. M2E.F.Ca.ET.166.01.1.1]|nr:MULTISPECIES: hypothetical protein [unclassified Mesorhizobium]TGT78000.1 hypothetical protein EN809_003585 [Mesorhizobium sp. M2E.F.Ca.ET.166.01.1.1]TGW04114.1 hypothetical protein EN797_003585 [Mesorhizobium sp. M2E.F.Ca.ET.154.01.1.1]
MLAICSGCSTSAELKKASADKGIAAARVTLPPLPDDCRAWEPHAAVNLGDEARSVLKAERRQLDRANARVRRCAANYDATAKALQ